MNTKIFGKENNTKYEYQINSYLDSQLNTNFEYVYLAT